MSDATTAPDTDWDPGIYFRFRGLRLRPALDLLRAVGPLPEGCVVDLGCGAGSVGPALGQLRRRLIGVDASPSMLEKARLTGVYDALHEADLASWRPDEPASLIFANASLHWVGNHPTLLPALIDALSPGGVLAVQLPNQNNAPSHRLWVQIAEEMFPDQVDAKKMPRILLPAEYFRLLAPLGRVTVWETEYYQELAPDGEGHPVRRFTEGTYARPVLSSLSESQQAQLVAAYERVIGKAYPKDARGTVLFPFRRLFITLHRDG
ncbi:trans-aconitate 2-methyltransferase [Roseivivax marinus]|jgi:trans-aconitate 2-methyltransferase|uniref:Trans-aconitate 2-methyltransferase n=1 Tax=Roseivivax marinus TaxID=1379903 RepID=W4HGN1_9RHOB|nr:methyltransferase domain-containing protein [Roseivivax marinus]ETW11311.1 trans-aconitate 2-methyltransferase [Roseivivax marinus]UMA64123.1 methyltransferase domain-containing protein [Roseivivax marinus]